jgi:hypothetical protein
VSATGGNGTGELSIVTVAAATASGIGVLGFVTFAGGTVLWARFQEMGLQADHAVSEVPTPELVVTGARVLVPALLGAIAAVLVMLGVDRAIRLVPWLRNRRQMRREFAGWTIAVIAGLVELGIAAGIGAGGLVAFLGLAAVAAANVGVLRFARTRCRLPAFALVVLLAVGSFFLARAYVLAANRLEVVPMAYIIKQPAGRVRVDVGYFVAQTSDQIFIAASTSGTDLVPNELRDFPRSEISHVEIGALTPPQQAARRAAHFGFNLCLLLAYLAPAHATPKRNPNAFCDATTERSYAKVAGVRIGVR